MKKLSYCGLFLVAAMGCGGSKKEPTVADKPESTAPMQNNVAQARTTPQPVVTNAAGTEPGEIVAVFLDSLRRGDENAANGVLTAQAQSELAKTDYVIQPLGTPEGNYKIGRVGFVDGDDSIGLVECVWTEPSPEAGQPPIELEIVCEVRKEAKGWRISGLAVKMTGTEEMLVLDFEDAASLQQALEEAGGKPADPNQTPNVAAVSSGQAVSGQTQFGQPQLGQPTVGQVGIDQQQLGAPPALPGQFSPTTQIAQPPTENTLR